MKITYDPEADAMYIYINKSKVKETKKINDNTIVDYDKEGNIVGIELLFIKENNPDLLQKISGKNVIVV